MLKIVVVDRTAESRNRIVEEINALLQSDASDMNMMPQVSIAPLAPEELKFHGSPNVCIIGEAIIKEEITEVGGIRKILPEAGILVRLPAAAKQNSLVLIEQLARLGADDVLPPGTSGSELLAKIILLARKSTKAKSGKLVLVDSGKGGVGVTAVTAGLAEALAANGKRVAVVDFDFETQDLSRFLQARPFINEGLQLLFDQQRPVTQEFIERCLVQVWDDELKLWCMPPVADSDQLFDSQSNYPRVLVSVLEFIDSQFDCVFVDVGSARGVMLKTLYRVADRVLIVVSNDPSSLYGCVNRLAAHRPLMSPEAEVVFLENATARAGLPPNFLKTEILRATKLDATSWIDEEVPFCKNAARWPGSAATIFSQGHEKIGKALNATIERLGLVDKAEMQRTWYERPVGLVSRYAEYFKKRALVNRVESDERDSFELPEPVRGERPLELPEPADLVSLSEIAPVKAQPVLTAPPVRPAQARVAPAPATRPAEEDMISFTVTTPNFGAPNFQGPVSPAQPVSREPAKPAPSLVAPKNKDLDDEFSGEDLVSGITYS